MEAAWPSIRRGGERKAEAEKPAGAEVAAWRLERAAGALKALAKKHPASVAAVVGQAELKLEARLYAGLLGTPPPRASNLPGPTTSISPSVALTCLLPPPPTLHCGVRAAPPPPERAGGAEGGTDGDGSAEADEIRALMQMHGVAEAKLGDPGEALR